MKNSFEGKVAVVTGSTRGIGKGIADLLASYGCEVIYTGTSHGIKVKTGTYHQLDMTEDKSVNNFIVEMMKLPRLDILVNNAGINAIESINQITDNNWEQILRVNLSGAMMLIRMAAQVMKTNSIRGKILNISSIFGVVSRTGRGAYSASKSALIGLTRSVALDLASDNILVNALCPGFTLTDLTKNILSEAEMNKLAETIPLRRMAEEMEIAKTAAFLCSDYNTYITGQTLVIDGGFTIK